MGGGQGTRLFPLTKNRCKPAVPIGGKYRLVDVPISNCLHSGYNKIYLLTQFHTRSLHRHIQDTYRFDRFDGGSVEILSAEQVRGKPSTWYEGTADAVRKNLHYLDLNNDDLVIILAGDQLYRMDFSKMVQNHLENGAEITVAAKVVPLERLSNFGAMEIDSAARIQKFVEKPKAKSALDRLKINHEQFPNLPLDCDRQFGLASMGNYVFRFGTLKKILDGHEKDFGKELLPKSIQMGMKIFAFLFDDYWEDIGTIRSFFDANLALTDARPPFDFFDANWPIFTRPQSLPASKVESCRLDRALVAEGCLIRQGTTLERCVIGQRSTIGQNSRLQNVLTLGNDERQDTDDRAKMPLGIGNDCQITNAIIDQNVRIGNGVCIDAAGKKNGDESCGCVVIDGIVCIPVGTVLPDGFQF